MPDRPATTSPRIRELTQKLDKDPRSRVFVELAKAHHAAGNPDEAVRVCREGLQRQPGYHSARAFLGKLLLEMSEHGEAITELRRVVTDAPGNLLARRLLGEAQEGAGFREEALETLKELQALLPGDPDVDARVARLAGELSAAAGRSPGEGPATAGVETLDLRQNAGEPGEPLVEMPSAGIGPAAFSGSSGSTEAAEAEPAVEAAEVAESGPGAGQAGEAAPVEEDEPEEPVLEESPGPVVSAEVEAETPAVADGLVKPEEPREEPEHPVGVESGLPEAGAPAGDLWSRPTEAIEPPSRRPTPGGEPAEPPPAPEVGASEAELAAGDLETPGAGMEEAGPEVPRTVTLDPAEIARMDSGEDQPTQVLTFPPAAEVPAAEPPGEEAQAAGQEPSIPVGGEVSVESPGQDEGRTVVMPVPEEAGPGEGPAPVSGLGETESPGGIAAAPGDREKAPEQLPAPEASGEADEALPTPTLAELYVEQGMPDKAADVYRRILEGDPGNDEVRRRLSVLSGEEVPAESPARAKIRALQGWLETIKRSHDAQSGP